MKILSLLLVLVLMGLPVWADDAFDAAFDASMARVAAEYPATTDPQSRLWKKMIAIDKQWEAAGDARYNEATKPELIVAVAVDELATEMWNEAVMAWRKRLSEAGPETEIVVDVPKAREAAFRVFSAELPEAVAADLSKRLAKQLRAVALDEEELAQEEALERVPARPRRPAPAIPPWIQRQNEDDDTVISAGPPPSSATVYGADGSIRRVFNNGTGSTTVYGPEGVTRIFPK